MKKQFGETGVFYCGSPGGIERLDLGAWFISAPAVTFFRRRVNFTISRVPEEDQSAVRKVFIAECLLPPQPLQHITVDRGRHRHRFAVLQSDESDYPILEIDLRPLQSKECPFAVPDVIPDDK